MKMFSNISTRYYSTSRKYSTILAVLIITSFVLLYALIVNFQTDLLQRPKPMSDNFINSININLDNYNKISINSITNKLKGLGNIIKENVGSIINKLTPVQSPPENDEENLPAKKLILFWSKWFSSDWSDRFGDYTLLHNQGCPSWHCEFTYNKSRLHEADAVVIRSGVLGGVRKDKNISHIPSQVWVYVDVEAPLAQPARSAMVTLRQHNLNMQVNWTMTYHRNADIVAFYGYFLALNQTVMPLRPNLMSSYPETMEEYQKARDMGITLEEVMGSDWKNFVDRPRLVSWMSSHCGTNSKREEYVRELQKFIDVDTFGNCGKMGICLKKGPLQQLCWENVMRPNYLFYMSMENNLCQDYITEKLYNPLVNGLVPVVWGGSNYSEFLPPGSYIDARMYHPRDLAHLLMEVKNDPVRYGRYHVWRNFWQPNIRGSMCELCDKLHKNIEAKHYEDIPRFRKTNGQCMALRKEIFETGNWPWYVGMNHSVP